MTINATATGNHPQTGAAPDYRAAHDARGSLP